MPTEYEFLPGRGSQYSGRIRAFVLRNQKRKEGPKVEASQGASPASPTSGQIVPYADAQNLLQSQLDPFQTSAAPTNAAESSLLHHFLHDCFPDYGRHRNETFFPPRDTDLQLIRTDALPISASLQSAAMSITLLRFSRPESLAFAEKCRTKMLTSLRHRLESEGHNPPDGLIHTLIGVVAVETHIRMARRPTHLLEDHVEVHVSGLRAALDSRYGWDLSYYHPTLQWELTWQNICLDNMILARKTSFSSHLHKMLPGDVSKPRFPDSPFQKQWEHLCALEFIGAYEDFHDLATLQLHSAAAHSAAHQSPNTEIPKNPRSRDLFQVGTHSYKTMASKDTIWRTIVPILLINIMLFQQQGASSEEAAYQYWALRRKFIRCDVELGSGPAFLTFAIGMEPDMKSWTDQTCMDLLGRMLSVEVRLTQQTRTRLEASLLGFVSTSGHGEVDKWCSPEETRAIVFEELLSISSGKSG